MSAPPYHVQRDGPLVAVGDAMRRALLLTDARAVAAVVRAGRAEQSPALRHRGYPEHLHVTPDALGGVGACRTDGHAALNGEGPVVVEARLFLADRAAREAFAGGPVEQLCWLSRKGASGSGPPKG